ARLGRAVAGRISDQFVIEHARHAGDRQPVAHTGRAGLHHPALARAARLMESAIERPLSITGLATAVGLSDRQLERLFQRHLGTKPGGYYLGLRLARARELLTQTAMPITDV